MTRPFYASATLKNMHMHAEKDFDFVSDIGTVGGAGTSIVQFARGTGGTGLAAYALKFFAHRATYDEEARLYQSFPKQLRRFMPAVEQFVPNEDLAIRDPFGNVLAPFIVMEKGESLRDRAKHSRVDLFTAAQVMHCLMLVILWVPDEANVVVQAACTVEQKKQLCWLGLFSYCFNVDNETGVCGSARNRPAHPL